MFNLRYIFLLQCSYQTAALQAFGKCRSIISPRSPKDAKRENKHKQKKETRHYGSFLSCMLFALYESFAWQIFASLGLFTFARIACLLQLWIKTISITLFGRRPIKKTYVNITLLMATLENTQSAASIKWRLLRLLMCEMMRSELSVPKLRHLEGCTHILWPAFLPRYPLLASLWVLLTPV